MHIKSFRQKDRYGNEMAVEFFDVPPMQDIPQYDHPGEPKGPDTVPAWLTPGEFVVNAEAVRMFEPQIEAMNEAGRDVQRAQGGTIPEGGTMPDEPVYAEDGQKVNTEKVQSYHQQAVNAYKDPKTRLSSNMGMHISRWKKQNPPQYKSEGGLLSSIYDSLTLPKAPPGIVYKRLDDGSIGQFTERTGTGGGQKYLGRLTQPKKEEGNAFSKFIGMSEGGSVDPYMLEAYGVPPKPTIEMPRPLDLLGPAAQSALGYGKQSYVDDKTDSFLANTNFGEGIIVDNKNRPQKVNPNRIDPEIPNVLGQRLEEGKISPEQYTNQMNEYNQAVAQDQAYQQYNTAIQGFSTEADNIISQQEEAKAAEEAQAAIAAAEAAGDQETANTIRAGLQGDKGETTEEPQDSSNTFSFLSGNTSEVPQGPPPPPEPEPEPQAETSSTGQPPVPEVTTTAPEVPAPAESDLIPPEQGPEKPKEDPVLAELKRQQAELLELLSPKTEDAQQEDKDIDDTPDDTIKKAADNVPKTTMDKIKGYIMEGFGEIFSGPELAKAVMYYAGSRALGHSHRGSLNYVVKNYASNVESQVAARKKAAAEKAALDEQRAYDRAVMLEQRGYDEGQKRKDRILDAVDRLGEQMFDRTQTLEDRAYQAAQDDLKYRRELLSEADQRRFELDKLQLNETYDNLRQEDRQRHDFAFEKFKRELNSGELNYAFEGFVSGVGQVPVFKDGNGDQYIIYTDPKTGVSSKTRTDDPRIIGRFEKHNESKHGRKVIATQFAASAEEALDTAKAGLEDDQKAKLEVNSIIIGQDAEMAAREIMMKNGLSLSDSNAMMQEVNFAIRDFVQNQADVVKGTTKNKLTSVRQVIESRTLHILSGVPETVFGNTSPENRKVITNLIEKGIDTKEFPPGTAEYDRAYKNAWLGTYEAFKLIEDSERDKFVRMANERSEKGKNNAKEQWSPFALWASKTPPGRINKIIQDAIASGKLKIVNGKPVIN
jgi:hypothetical protein